MIDLHSLLVRELQRMHGNGAFLWLFKFTPDETTQATTVFRILNQRAEVQFEEPQIPSGYALKTYYPYAVDHSGLEEGTQGGIPQLNVTVSNVDRLLGQKVFEGHGFSGMRVDIFVAHESHVAVQGAHWQLQMQVGDINIGRNAVTFQLRARNPMQMTIPHELFGRRICRHRFGDEKSCGFPLFQGGPTVCDKLLATCRSYGDIAFTKGLPRLWPRQFGGEPAIEEAA